MQQKIGAAGPANIERFFISTLSERVLAIVDFTISPLIYHLIKTEGCSEVVSQYLRVPTNYGQLNSPGLCGSQYSPKMSQVRVQHHGRGHGLYGPVSFTRDRLDVLFHHQRLILQHSPRWRL